MTTNNQRGSSVTGIVLLIICLGLLGKLGIGIIPAYVGEYQLRKLVAQEVEKANAARLTDRKFLDALNQQLSINANYDTKAEDVIQFMNKTPGALRVKIMYEDTYQYYGNTYIVNRFEREITPEDAK